MFRRAFLPVLFILVGTAPATAVDCSKRTCSRMSSCAEAYAVMRGCGARRLDGDGDGVPCESLCGGGAGSGGRDLLDAPSGGAYACGGRTTCKAMRSCAEARYHLTVCGETRLDRDGDGVPCESLCR